MSNVNEPRIIVAMDYPTAKLALALVDRLDPSMCRLKVGKELFANGGPSLVEQLVLKGFDVFLDQKYHDIPTTVAKACKVASTLGVWMMNVHAMGGPKMLEGARDAIDSCQHKPLLIAVTALTSMDQSQLDAVGIQGKPQEVVSRLAGLAKDARLDGVVCSPNEVATLRKEHDAGFRLVTPGIRPAGADNDDQKRVSTPEAAIDAGSDFLVIGRPITEANDPISALQNINKSLSF